MKEFISQVHTITSAGPWYQNGSYPDPVLCFALVSVMSNGQFTGVPSKRIIALTEHDLGCDLEGMEIDKHHLGVQIHHPEEPEEQ